MKKILVLEDEPSIRSFVVINLRRSGYEPIEAATGEQALEKLKQNPDTLVALLDVMLPDIDGFEVCRRIRATGSKMGILMLSAKSQEMDKITGLTIGADDYITKPFSMPVVVKHIEAVLRRAEQGAGAETNILRYKDLTLDTDSFTVLVKDESVALTIREFEILKLLVENQGRVFTRESLLDSIWGYDYFGDEKIVNTHIKNIRKKLGVNYIETIRGAGYKIEKEN